MALPASGPISSSMIAQEFSSSQAPSGPNISLKGLASELSTPLTSDIFMGASFYGQSAVSLTSFIALLDESNEPFEDGEAACNAEEVTQNTWYHNGIGTNPAEGDDVYTNSGGTTDAPDGYFRIGTGRGANSFNIESGQIGEPPGIC